MIEIILRACFDKIQEHVHNEDWTHDLVLVPDTRERSLRPFRREPQFEESYQVFAEYVDAPCIIWSHTTDSGIDIVVRFRGGGERVYETHFNELGRIHSFYQIAESTDHVFA